MNLPDDLEIIESGNFKTGKPVTFNYLRNTVSSRLHVKSGYQQNLEPSGMYVSLDYSPGAPPLPEWQKGKMTLKNPLVIPFNTKSADLVYDKNSWKQNLVNSFKKKKNALSIHLKKLGFDGIVTVCKIGKYKGDISEIIKL